MAEVQAGASQIEGFTKIRDPDGSQKRRDKEETTRGVQMSSISEVVLVHSLQLITSNGMEKPLLS